MDVDQILEQVRENLTVRRVFGDPIERDGVLVIPVASVAGGGGGGQGSEERADGGSAGGNGGGFGLRARAAGVYVVRDGAVTWEPAIDVTRLVLGGQAVALAAIFAFRAVARARLRSQSGRKRQA